ncbi:helix-turn-helix transcriptional regulator [Halorubrum halodurans]|uniref:HTH iclR-type domain-containing protein n=1 Tax=Halorubrum halodurans TaxID=1383851 RepID=A0A256IIU7_9EURY|nr:hypothetical protein [Halorubrum halodurans]OYR56226.1 hypothetical protein DJ70_09290 [Halorubrum halodurans]
MKRTTLPPVPRRLLVVGLLIGGLLVGASGGVAGVAGDPFAQQEEIDPDDVLITAAVDADGDAVWTIEYRVRLSTSDEERAFEEFRTDLEANPAAYADRFRGRMETTVNESASATGREMSVSNVSVTAERREIPQEYGIVTYRFRWGGFAAVEDGRIAAGDAIDGLFLDEESSLIVSWPDSHELETASPAPAETRDGSVVWVGPVDFAGGEPRIAAVPDSVVNSIPSGLPLLAAGLLVVLGGAAAYARRERGSSTTSSGASPAESGAASTAGAGDVEGRPDDGSGSAVVDDPDGSTGAGSTDEGSAEGDPAEGAPTDEDPPDGDGGTPPVDAELLSNEEQVLRLIEREGGRMKQKRVAEELDWTAAKTSQVVTGLRDEGDLEGFRLGRENVLRLPGEDDGDSADGDDRA